MIQITSYKPHRIQSLHAQKANSQTGLHIKMCSSGLAQGYTYTTNKSGNNIEIFIYSGKNEIGRCLGFKNGPLKRRPHIQSISVDTEHQNQGIGSFLVEQMLEELGGKEISLYSEYNGLLYTRLGFEKTDETDGLGGQKHDYLIYKKK